MTKHTKENDRLRKIVESFPKVTVTVLADLVADEYVFGEISRVSREAPVLILRHRDRKVVPGGGANAIYNLADLGVTVLPVGIVGDDEPGRLLLRSFRHKRIPVSGVLKDKSYPTVTKPASSPALRILPGSRWCVWTGSLAKAQTRIFGVNWFWPRENTAGPRTRCWFPTTGTVRRPRHC